MILDKETKDKFGYLPSSLTKSSSKKVVVKCDYCGLILDKTMKQITAGRKYTDVEACHACRFKKREDVSIARDGVKNSAQRKDVREKLSSVNIEDFHEEIVELSKKYGHSYIAEKLGIPSTSLHRYMKRHNISGDISVQQRRENTFKDKTGQDYKEWRREQLKDMSQQKYGVDNMFMAEEIKQKSKETMMEKYGVEHCMQSKEIRDKSKSTVLKKYGVENVSQNDEIQGKIKQTNKDRYGYDNPMKNKNVVKKMLQTRIDNGEIHTYNNKRIREISEELNRPYSTLVVQIRKYGPDAALKMKNKNKSILEQLMESHLKSIGVNYVPQFRVENRIADFFLPDYNIIIECDGLYWHSDAVIQDKNYHKDKRDLYISKGYRPFFFREDELRDKFNIIKSILSNAMHMNTRRLFARKCTPAQLTPTESNAFFSLYHLMGPGKGPTFALLDEDKFPVAALQILNTYGEHHISRFCTAPNCTVVGALSKLLKFAHTTIFFSAISTFIDLRYGEGSYLERSLGFEKLASHISFKWTDGINTFHRLTKKGNSGYYHGLAKIWDCGQAKYRLVYNTNINQLKRRTVCHQE